MSDILTPRQSELMDLLCTGMTNRQLGKALHISESTVKATIRNIQERLPSSVITTRTGLAMWYVNYRNMVVFGCARVVVNEPNEQNLARLAAALEVR